MAASGKHGGKAAGWDERSPPLRCEGEKMHQALLPMAPQEQLETAVPQNLAQDETSAPQVQGGLDAIRGST